MHHLCNLCIVFAMLLRLFIADLWSPAGKGLTFWLSVWDVLLCFVTFTCGILGQVWSLIVSIPDLCHLSYTVTLLHMSELIGLKTDLTQETNKTKHNLNKYYLDINYIRFNSWRYMYLSAGH